MVWSYHDSQMEKNITYLEYCCLKRKQKARKEINQLCKGNFVIIRFERAYISSSFDNVITSVGIVFFVCVTIEKKQFIDRNSVAYLF